MLDNNQDNTENKVDKTLKMKEVEIDAVKEIEDNIAEDAEKDDGKNSIPMPEYSDMELELLVNELHKLLKNNPVQQLKANIDVIKNVFNTKFGSLLAEKKAAFLEEGGDSIDFQYSPSVKTTYNKLLSEYKSKRDLYYSEIEEQRKSNLRKRHIVIDELKNLIDNGDAKTMYKTFKEIEIRWKEIGPVPRNKYNDTWRSYHYNVERFYDLLHLRNDLRDLDFKHNLEEKLKIVSKAEELAEKENTEDAFKKLQDLHKRWKEDIGPVSKEYREDIWRRFSNASKKIHTNRHRYFKKLRLQHKDIIDKKLAVITAIEDYDTSSNEKHSDWKKSIKYIDNLRQEYFDAGKLPHSKSEELWDKFKKATKKFNKSKNRFYKEEKNVQYANLDKKKALIKLAESLKDSEDWEATTNTFKKIQADWKKIGHVPIKFSNDTFKVFNDTCNYYFEKYRSNQGALSKEQQAFTDKKKGFLEEMKKTENVSIYEINEAIKKWRSFGISHKNLKYLDAKFNKNIDTLLKKLSLSKDEISMIKFKNMIDIYLHQEDFYKLNSEQLFIRKKIDENNREIQQLENNLSFISNATEDNPFVKKVRENVDECKNKLAVWKEKLSYIKGLPSG